MTDLLCILTFVFIAIYMTYLYARATGRRPLRFVADRLLFFVIWMFV